MELQQLKYFRAVAHAHSFTRAARRLFVTQPNVSVQIRKLEHELGVTLFDRVPGGSIALTAAGEVLQDCADSIFSTLDGGLARIRALERERLPLLRIAHLPSLGRTVLPGIVVSIREAAPEIDLTCDAVADSERIRAMLLDGAIDVGVARTADGRDTETSHVLFTEEFVVACPAHGPLRDLDLRDAASLSRAPFVLPSEGIGLRDQILGICRSMGFDPRVVLEAYSLDVLRGAVARGVGVSVLPQLCLDGQAEMTSVRLPQPSATRTISLTWRRQASAFRRCPQLARCLSRTEFAPEPAA